MSPEFQFFLYALRQRWLTEDLARDAWQKWQHQPEVAEFQDFVRKQATLSEDQVRQGLDMAGMTLSLERFPHIGEYETVECLDRGSHGVVFRAQAELSSDVVAVKVLAPRLYDDLVYLQEFTKQAQAAGRVTLESVASTLTSGEMEGHYYLVSEFVPGESLDRIVSREGPWAEERALDLLSALAECLEQVHAKGLVHGGIKPSSIRVTPEGEFRLLNLGLAKESPEEAIQEAALRLGAEHYLSPEQVAHRTVDIRSDLFALGAVLVFTVTGKAPFAGEAAAALLPKPPASSRRTRVRLPPNRTLSQGFTTLLGRMMARSPEDRYPTPKALLADVETVKAGKPPRGPALGKEQTLMPSLSPAASGPESGPEKRPASPEGEAARPAAASASGSSPRSGARGSRPRPGSASAAKSPMRWVGLVLPAVLVLAGLIFLRGRNAQESDSAPADDEPLTTTSLSSEQQAIQNEYLGIQKFIRENPDEVEEARTKLAEFEKKIQDNVLFQGYRRQVKSALTQLDSIEKDTHEKEKERLKSPMPSANLVSNGGFEPGDGEHPEGWTLVGAGGKWEAGEAAVEGRRSLSLSRPTGPNVNRSANLYWRGTAYPVETHQLYRVSFQIRTDQWRQGRDAYVFAFCNRQDIEPSPTWKKEEFVFLSPTLLEETSSEPGGAAAGGRQGDIRLGVAARPGQVFYDDLRIVKVKVWNPTFHGIQLGVNEKIESGIYTYKLVLQIYSSNYARCLQNFNAASTPSAWELDENHFVLYAHEVEKHPQRKNLLMTVGTDYHQAGSALRVEVSKDLGEWHLVHTQSEKGSKSVRLPPELYPADAIYVKFTADGYCRLSAYTYMAELEGKTPTRFVGTSEFVE